MSKIKNEIPDLRSFFYIFIFLTLSACSKVGNFFASKCEGDNLNCLGPGLTIISSGAKVDASSDELEPGAEDVALSFPDIKYGETKIIELEITNPKLFPLLNFSALLTSSDAGYLVVNNGDDDDCAQILELRYQESCKVTLVYTYSGGAPGSAQFQFLFESPQGEEIVFNAEFEEPTGLPDFTIGTADLTYPDLLVYETSAAPTPFEREITITNHGEETITAMNYAMTSSDFSVTTASLNSCTLGGTLAGLGGTCKLKVTFTPLSVGSVSTSLVLTGAGGLTKTYTLSGSGRTLTPDVLTYDFGVQPLSGPPLTHDIQFSNLTSSDETSDASACTVSLTNNVGSEFSTQAASSSDCTAGISIAEGSSCNKNVIYTPSASEITSAATLTIDCNSRGGTRTVALTGSSGLSLLWTGNGDFGDVATSSNEDQIFTLTNQSTLSAITNLTVGLSTQSSAEFSIVSNACGTTLAASATCNVTVRFLPTNAGGETATLSASNGTLNGTKALTTMFLNLSSATLNLGARDTNQAGSATGTITITNNGTRQATLVGTIVGGSSAVFTNAGTGTCGATLAIGASCTYIIAFTAAATAASHTGTFRIAESSSTAKNYDIALSATTTNAPLLEIIDNRANITYENIIAASDITGPVDDANNIVGNVPTSRAVTFTIKNTGSGASSSSVSAITANLTNSSGTSGTMTISSNTCTGATLDQTETCSIVVTYDPATASPETSTYSLSISSTGDTGGATYTSSVTSIVGASISPASIAIASGSPVDFGLSALSTANTSSNVNVENSGTHAGTSMTYTVTTNPSSVFSKTTGSSSDCGATLAGSANCNIRAGFNPGTTVGVFEGVISVAGNNGSGASTFTTQTVPLVGASAQSLDLDTATTFVADGLNGDIEADSDRVYSVFRETVASGVSHPILVLCARHTTGGVNVSDCDRANVATILGYDDTKNLAGTGVGSGPRIAISTSKILIALQNQADDISGTASYASIVACEKPSSSAAVSSCFKFNVDTTAGNGEMPSIAISTSKVFMIFRSTTNEARIAICDFDSSSLASASTLSNCTNSNATSANQGAYASFALDSTNSRILISSQDKSATDSVVRLTICSYSNVTASNSLSNCTSSTSSAGTLDASGVVDAIVDEDIGTYSTISYESNRVNIVHQQHETSDSTNLRILSCSVGVGTNLIGTCAASSVVNTGAYFGKFPSHILADNFLWLSAATFSSGTLGNRKYNLQIWKCSKHPISCAASPYYTQSTAPAWGQNDEHNLYFDSAKNILFVPYRSNSTGVNGESRNAITEIGLSPEL